MQIVSWIDENNVPPYLINAKLIRKWVEEQESPKLPRRSRNIEGIEKDLGNKLSYIRQDLIKPYMILQTEQEREEFRSKHPEIDEVLEIISELDMQCGTQKQKELAVLIRQDLEKRKALQKARKLEQDYEHQLSSKMGEISVDTQNQGVDYDE